MDRLVGGFVPGPEVDDKPHDECGVFAIYAPGEKVGTITYRALQRQQHRGQSGAGIAYRADDRGQLIAHTGAGLIDRAIPDAVPFASGVSPVDHPETTMAIGHTRYSTAESEKAYQPFISSLTDPSFALAHNGHLEMLEEVAARYGIDPASAPSDTGLLAMILDKRGAELDSLDQALAEVTPQLNGAYNLVLTDGQRIIGVRDPWGLRPLSLATLTEGRGYMLASEEVAFKGQSLDAVREVERGEIVVIDEHGVKSSLIDRQEPASHCMHELGYLARPEGQVYGVGVYMARKNMGRFLAIDHPVDADVVVGVPNSGLSAAAGYARQSRIPQVLGLFKDEYVGRSFIERGAKRDDILERKLAPNEEELRGRHVILVDDSLIKGNTMKALVKAVRAAGAQSVHVRLAMPRYEHPCYGGMDTRDTSRLIARHMTDEEIAGYIEADTVAYNSVERVRQAVQEAAAKRSAARIGSSLCTACTTGEYPHPVPSPPDSLSLPASTEELSPPTEEIKIPA